MHIAQDYRLEEWIAPPQEDFPRPRWTKLFVDGEMLSNSIEYAEWRSNPVYPMACELCWSAGCCYDEWVRIVRLESQVLWMRPHARDIDKFHRDMVNPEDLPCRSLLMPRRMWDEFAHQFSVVPRSEKLPQVDEYDLIWLWFDTMPAAVRPSEFTSLPDHLQQSCLASNPIDLPDAIAIVRSLVRCAEQPERVAVDGDFTTVDASQEAVTTFYFDGPPFHEWPAFAGNGTRLVIEGNWLTPKINCGLEP